jgi:hypothetical protein
MRKVQADHSRPRLSKSPFTLNPMSGTLCLLQKWVCALHNHAPLISPPRLTFFHPPSAFVKYSVAPPGSSPPTCLLYDQNTKHRVLHPIGWLHQSPNLEPRICNAAASCLASLTSKSVILNLQCCGLLPGFTTRIVPTFPMRTFSTNTAPRKSLPLGPDGHVHEDRSNSMMSWMGERREERREEIAIRRQQKLQKVSPAGRKLKI